MNARFRSAQAWLAWRLQRSPIRHGTVWLLCMAACTLMAYRAATLRAEVDALRSSLRYQAQTAAATMPNGSAGARSDFIAFFPNRDPVESFLTYFYAEAERGGITVARVSVEEVPPPLPALKRQNIHISLQARDDHYRALIYRMLQEFPAMTLSRLSIQRTDAEGVQVELVWGAISR